MFEFIEKGLKQEREELHSNTSKWRDYEEYLSCHRGFENINFYSDTQPVPDRIKKIIQDEFSFLL